jgi:protein-tyrosine phosphatase
VENGKDMSYSYYESGDGEVPTYRDFGDIQIKVESRSEKYSGLVKRKIRVRRATHKNDEGEKQYGEETVVTHYQETKWDDNRAPDHSCEEGVFERVNHLLKKIKKNRDTNPLGSVLVHCR